MILYLELKASLIKKQNTGIYSFCSPSEKRRLRNIAGFIFSFMKTKTKVRQHMKIGPSKLSL